jgi:predicted dehydrogenase
MIKAKICVIGGGGWGQNHIKTLDRLGYLGGIVDVSLEILKSYDNLNSQCLKFTNLDEAINQNFDGFVIATPAETHYDIAKKLIKHSNNVLIEKPVCLNFKDANDLLLLAKQNNSFIMGGHLLLFHPAFIKIRELIKTNLIGDIKYMYSNRLNFGKVRNHENALWSLGPHDISLLLFFNNENIKSISYSESKIINREISDSSLINIKFNNDIDSHIYLSWFHPYKEHNFVIIGDKGMISYKDSDPKKEIIFYHKSIEFEKGNNFKHNLKDEGFESIDYAISSPLDSELNYFVESIKNNKKDLGNFELSINVVKILEKIGEIKNG